MRNSFLMVLCLAFFLSGCFDFNKKAAEGDDDDNNDDTNGGTSDGGGDYQKPDTGSNDGNGGDDDDNDNNDNDDTSGDDDDDVNTCVPNCEGKLCGNDGCNGSCGECPKDRVCEQARCVREGFNLTDTMQTNCYDDKVKIACPTKKGSLYWGQDANYLGANVNLETISEKILLERSSGVMYYNVNDKQARTWNEAFNFCVELDEGGNEWRMPKYVEALMLVDFSGKNPAFNEFKVKIDGAESYWLDEPYPLKDGSHLIINYSRPYIEEAMSDPRALCVSGHKPRNDFEDMRDVVADKAYNLMWQKATGGTMTWKDALEYCNNLQITSYSGWRLPNVKELATLLMPSAPKSPYINQEFFPDTEDLYWSSTTCEGSWCGSSGAWQVHFNSARIDTMYKGQTHEVRCVRDL